MELTSLTPGIFPKAIIDYDAFPIKCRFGTSTEHLIRGCTTIPTKKFGSGASAPPQPGSRLGYYSLQEASQ